MQEAGLESESEGLPVKSTLAIMGQRLQDFLAGLTGANLSNSAFPLATWQDLHVGHSLARAQRITFVGELGRVLNTHSDCVRQVFETMLPTPQALRLRGSMAVDSCRTERGFRHWGHDIGPFGSPAESDLVFACNFEIDFVGKRAFPERRANGAQSRQLSSYLNDPDALVLGREPILREGEIVGRLTSVAFGWSVGGAAGLGVVA